MNAAELNELLNTWQRAARELVEALSEVRAEVMKNELGGHIYDLRNNVARLKSDENQRFEEYLHARQNFYGQEENK